MLWLNELQDYLDFAGGVPGGQVRELIAAGVVLVATCRPGEHSKRVALPEKDRPDPYANDRRLLGPADVLHVPAAFSTDEGRRAKDLAGTDHRIRTTLDTPDAGFTQVMTAGPELIRHWTQAPGHAMAVITAALDTRRVGAHAPLYPRLLAGAAPGHLNEQDVATAPQTGSRRPWTTPPGCCKAPPPRSLPFPAAWGPSPATYTSTPCEFAVASTFPTPLARPNPPPPGIPRVYGDPVKSL
ncbi:hypothetical protein ACIOD2_49685 [Amycolatopsis sp. NPDC088138]|uniref:hypothetical protein n=1 Tax=Amycolatopsis sp. NPDC088138 TaxID=3363938 RepID=UPI00382C7728